MHYIYFSTTKLPVSMVNRSSLLSCSRLENNFKMLLIPELSFLTLWKLVSLSPRAIATIDSQVKMKIVTSESSHILMKKIATKIVHYRRKKELSRVSFQHAQIQLSTTKPVSIQEQAQAYWYFAPFCLKQHKSNRMAEKNLCKKELKPLRLLQVRLYQTAKLRVDFRLLDQKSFKLNHPERWITRKLQFSVLILGVCSLLCTHVINIDTGTIKNWQKTGKSS